MSERELHIPPERTLIQHLDSRRKKLHLSQKDIGDALGLNQANVSKLFQEERRLRYDEAYLILQLVHQRSSTMPDKLLSEYYTRNVKSVCSDEPTWKAAAKMKEEGFTQIPVIDRRTNECLGLVTDWTLLVRMLEPLKAQPKETWLKHLAELPLREADVIDKVPEYPVSSPLVEIAEGLLHHYGVLVRAEHETQFGIITRADFLRLILG
jgi:predicted transcriptional regulator